MNEDNKHTKTKIIVSIIIIIIIILLLLTSCNSRLFGKIGDLFQSSSSHTIKDNDKNNIKEEKNSLVKFDTRTSNITTDDNGYKLSFSSSLINADYGCSTSDASIALCAVFKDYVEIYPKKEGEVDITLKAIKDNVAYTSTNRVNISKGNKHLTLSKNKVTSYLDTKRTINISYDTNGILGDISVEVENPKIVSATAEDGILTITAKKAGTTKVTLKIKNNSQEYKASVTVTVLGEKPHYISTTRVKTTKKKTTTSKVIDDETTTTKRVTNPTNSSSNTTKSTNSSSSSSSNTTKSTNSSSSSSSDTTKSTKSTSSSSEVVHNYSVSLNTSGNLDLSNGYVDISYSIKDGEKDVTSLYDLTEVTINNGLDYEIPKRGIIRIKPNNYSQLNNTNNIRIKFNDKVSNGTFKITSNYYVDYNDENSKTFAVKLADITTIKDIPFITNLLSNSFSTTGTTNKHIILTDNTNKTKVDISLSDESIANIEFVNDPNSDSKTIKVKPLTAGTTNIIIKGYLFNNEISNISISLTVTQNYNVTIDANGGFFSKKSDGTLVTKHGPFLAEEVNLVSYNEAYKLVNEANCEYYKIKEYNTKSDGTGIKYNLTDTVTISSNLTLYAIYDENNLIKPEITSGTLNLNDVNVFGGTGVNIIYPGSSGKATKENAHTIKITNDTGKKIKLKNIILEEDNYCVDVGYVGCINMGYIVKYNNPSNSNNTFFYGLGNGTEKGYYKILNSDPNTIKTQTAPIDNYYQTRNSISLDSDPIILENGQATELTLLWKWVSSKDIAPSDNDSKRVISDKLDTKIGTDSATISTDGHSGVYYSLHVSIDYSEVIDSCSVGD